MSGPLKDAAEVHEDSLGAQVSLKAPTFTCKARSGGDPAEPQDCDWPMCGCDPHADKVIAALQESDLVMIPRWAVEVVFDLAQSSAVTRLLSDPQKRMRISAAFNAFRKACATK